MPAYSMGLIMLHARLAQHVPRLANLLTHAPGVNRLVKRAGGLSGEREIPPFAHQTFKAWWQGRGAVNPQRRPASSSSPTRSTTSSTPSR